MVKRHSKQSILSKIHLNSSVTKAKKIIFHEAVIITLMLILLIGVSTFFRSYSYDLPSTDNWAEQAVMNNIRAGVSAQLDAQFVSTLPQAQREQFIQEQTQKAYEAQKDIYDAQIASTSAYFKSQLQDENGQTYLTGIDPYFWLSFAKDYAGETNFISYNEEQNKKEFALRNGQEFSAETFKGYSWLITKVHSFETLFDSDRTLLQTTFAMPIYIIGLTMIPIFFLARKIGGNLAGFIAGLLVAINGSLLGRTMAGFSDTDGFIVLFPALIAWLFFESMMAKKLWTKITWMSFAGLSMSVFIFFWHLGWFVGTILLGVLAVWFIYHVIRDFKQIKTVWRTKKILETPAFRAIILGCTYLGSVFIFASLFYKSIFSGFNLLLQNIIGPLAAVTIKQVGSGTNIWPNVLTTVAELNPGSWNLIFSSVGGTLFFVLGVLGIIATFFLKDSYGGFEIRYASLLVVWFGILVVASIIGMRFIALMAAPFAVAFGSFFGILWIKGSTYFQTTLNIPTRITKGIVIFILILLFMGIPGVSAFEKTPFGTAQRTATNHVPSINDAWFETLHSIKNDTDDGIITSWWDFGHWFVNIAERRVTFDGADQGRRIHWVGNLFLTEDEHEHTSVLRMLHCGQEEGFNRIEEVSNNSYDAIVTLKEIILLSREEAKQTLLDKGLVENETTYVLEKTHCNDEDLLDQYVIVSEDMVAKSAVWGHFGSWDFKKATAYNYASRFRFDKAVELMQNNLGLDKNQAAGWYYDATSLKTSREVESWVSPWPQYVTNKVKPCVETNNTLVCTINQQIGTQNGQTIALTTAQINLNALEQSTITITAFTGNREVGREKVVPIQITVGDGNNLETVRPTQHGFQYGLTAINNNGNWGAIIADPMLANSVFTRLFFFDAAHVSGYEKLSDVVDFTGQRIIVYKADLSVGE